jgi:DNA-binding NtrC family response regulator
MAEHILIVEDDRELREVLAEVLREGGYEAVAVPSAEAALREVDAGTPVDLVLSDLLMPGLPGDELLRQVRVRRPEVNVIVMTAFGSIDSAIGLMKAGAFDYLTKPLGTEDLLLAVERGLHESRVRREIVREAQADMADVPTGFVGTSPSMCALYALIARAATVGHAVLVTGESGTGKELVARALHRGSGREAFVTVNCGALPEHLLESELFGHEKGAFTGADRAKDGLFHVADRGTLFLDEIAELPLQLQPKLLRALEQAEVRRVGATQARMVDVRVIAATNRNLEVEVEQGRFRDDLYWRLNVLHLAVPPLRERRDDIPRLATHFLGRALAEGKIARTGEPATALPRSLAPEVMALLSAYSWPGNVRELRNAIQRAATLATGPVILPDDLPPRIRDAGRAGSLVAAAARRQLTLDEVERMYILQVLEQAGGNKSRTAELLGLDRKTLYRKLEEYRADGSLPPV